MGKIKYVIVSIVFVIICIVVVFSLMAKGSSYNDATVVLNGVVFSVDVVQTPQKRAMGLSHRLSLCKRCGMLFIFDQSDMYNFWMKDMRFDIDILWISNGRVVHIEERASYRTPQRIYSSGVSVAEVLEVRAGTVGELDVKVEDEIEIRL